MTIAEKILYYIFLNSDLF